MKGSTGIIIQMKTFKQCLSVMLAYFAVRGVSNFWVWVKLHTSECSYSNESSWTVFSRWVYGWDPEDWAVFSGGAVYYAVQGGPTFESVSKFWMLIRFQIFQVAVFVSQYFAKWCLRAVSELAAGLFSVYCFSLWWSRTWRAAHTHKMQEITISLTHIVDFFVNIKFRGIAWGEFIWKSSTFFTKTWKQSRRWKNVIYCMYQQFHCDRIFLLGALL